MHSRTKHIALKYHYLRESVEEGLITPHWIPTAKNQADIFTKPLPRDQFQYLVDAMGMREAPVPL
jgi:capsule polysaccharide modification protein KpsS